MPTTTSPLYEGLDVGLSVFPGLGVVRPDAVPRGVTSRPEPFAVGAAFPVALGWLVPEPHADAVRTKIATPRATRTRMVSREG